ncbi:MAG: hypothetical protein IPF39_12990 [Comamonadaceae bacterium]|uniref:hypothetical protein n=1 Tax=Candidatus Skiveiella danica TaxID=3386177 RepID=UPI00390B3D2F|nr:hypothetical protein [Comamonadaceae bacterium]
MTGSPRTPWFWTWGWPGVHGLLAAAAGARRVYLVEPEPVLRIAMEIAQANGLQDRVVALQGE